MITTPPTETETTLTRPFFVASSEKVPGVWEVRKQLVDGTTKRVWINLSGDSDLREATMVVLKLNDKYESDGDGRLIEDLVSTFSQS